MSRPAMTLTALALCLTLAPTARAAPGAAPSPAAICPLKVGQRVPAASVTDLGGAPVDLARLVTAQPTILVFVRGGWCPFCSLQMEQLRHVMAPLEASGYRLVVVSGETPDRIRSTIADLKLEYTVLSDATGQAAAAFGLAYRPRAEDFGSDTALAAWQAGRAKDAPALLPVPAVFVVHPSGAIVYQYANIDHRVRLSAEVLLTVARAYAPAR